jgi:ribosomal-protein-alanine N-acetyltransferase
MVNRNFNPFPILTTERLTLRQLSLDDQQNIFALRSDKEVNKYLDREPGKTIDDATNFINAINGNIQKNNSVYWAITLTENKSFVGTICVFDFLTETNSCEIGYELLPSFQGQGIMIEATKKVIEYAFQTLRCEKIIASTHTENEHSTKLLTKLNFFNSDKADKENPDLNRFTLTSPG